VAAPRSTSEVGPAAELAGLHTKNEHAPEHAQVTVHGAGSLAFLQPRRSETPVSGAAVISTARMRANMAPRLFTRALGGSNPLTLTISTSATCGPFPHQLGPDGHTSRAISVSDTAGLFRNLLIV
jgi:hypothetical protein